MSWVLLHKAINCRQRQRGLLIFVIVVGGFQLGLLGIFTIWETRFQPLE